MPTPPTPPNPSPPLALVQQIYRHFAQGDVPGMLAHLTPDAVWNEADNFPYADGNPYIGAQAVLEGVFARWAAEWDDLAAEIHAIHDAGQTIIATGRYLGTCKATARPQATQFAHFWTIHNNKVTHFQQYADTLGIAKVMGRV